jgi:hypothetical protein
MATWPGTLPPRLLLEGYQERLPRNKVRTEMDAGPAKQRRRYTAAVRPIAGAQILTTAQVASLKTFHDSTLQGGQDAFDWTDPIPNSGLFSFRFVSEPHIDRALGGGLYHVTYELEILPS